jgi:S-adenosylmethionine-diacylglycerol 3-amino-3-carboxypropyl transferase
MGLERIGFDGISQRWFRHIHHRHLVYTSCWEDPEADRLGLELTPSDRVLVITSAGCNALDYLLDQPASIDAVDLNYRQNALLELKRAAITTLPWDDMFRMLGHGHHPQARQIYYDLLRRRLLPKHRSFWDERIGWFGGTQPFYFQGTSGYLARGFSFYVDRVLGVRQAIADLLEAEDVSDQVEIYERHLQHRFWGPGLSWVLRQDAALALTGIPPQQRRQLQRSFPDLQLYLQQQAERVIYHLPIRENYFWRVYLTGRFTPLCCPAYLKPESQSRLRSMMARLQSHTGSVTDFLRRTPHRYTRFVLMDHMDWLTEGRAGGLAQEWQAIADRALPGARVLWRSLGTQCDFLNGITVHRDSRNIRLGDWMQSNSNLVMGMRQRERVTAYGFLGLVTLP